MKNKTLIIAEAGVNHNGDLLIAKKLIEVAADAGADMIKFQTFSADRIATKNSAKAAYQKLTTDSQESQYEMLKRLELAEDSHYELNQYCLANRIGFFSTGFDIQSIKFLVDMGQNLFKIPSGEITNLQYLRYVGELNKPIILSTGMATMEEIGKAISILELAGAGKELITVLHCTTEYPAPMSSVNLQTMLSIQKFFGVKIGYSDHTLGSEVAIAAVALGATVIEKHFTLDRNLPGPDHKASLEPKELKDMIASIRNIEVALGNGIKSLSSNEVKNRNIARKSLVALRDIKRGEIFSVENITAKRPGLGISPMRWDEIVGRVASRDFSQDELIEI
jgi:N,N'-diacetyllegionaminate synthase